MFTEGPAVTTFASEVSGEEATNPAVSSVMIKAKVSVLCIRCSFFPAKSTEEL
jgi:hypothetical protein